MAKVRDFSGEAALSEWAQLLETPVSPADQRAMDSTSRSAADVSSISVQ